MGLWGERTGVGGAAAGLDHAGGGLGLDLVHVLAAAGPVLGVLADAGLLHGLLNALLGLAVAGIDLLRRDGGSEGEDGNRVLHFDGCLGRERQRVIASEDKRVLAANKLLGCG